MSIGDYFRKLLGKEPPINVEAQPITFQPTSEQQANRNEARIGRLEAALKTEPDAGVRERLEAEIARRRRDGR